MQFDRDARRHAEPAAEAVDRYRRGTGARHRGNAGRDLELRDRPVRSADQARGRADRVSLDKEPKKTKTKLAPARPRSASSPITRARRRSSSPMACCRRTKAAATCCARSSGAAIRHGRLLGQNKPFLLRDGLCRSRRDAGRLSRAEGIRRSRSKGRADRRNAVRAHARHRAEASGG